MFKRLFSCYFQSILKTWFICLLLIHSLPSWGLYAQQLDNKPPVRIAYISDPANSFADEIQSIVEEELQILVRNDFNVQFPKDLYITVDNVMEDGAQAIQQLMEDERVSMVVTLGIGVSEIAIRGAPWSKPIIVSGVFDAQLQGFPETNGASGVTNLSYIAPPPPGPVIRDLLKFRDLTYFERVALLLEETAAVTYNAFIDQLAGSALQRGITLVPVPVGMTASSVLESLPTDTDAIYLAPLPHLNPDEFILLIEELTNRQLPTFSFSADDVHKGVMASVGSIDFPLMSRRIALNAYRIILGDDPSTLPVTFASSEELVLNIRTLQELLITPPLDMLLEARRLFEDPDNVERIVTLQIAMEEARSTNLELAIEDQEITSGIEDVRIARADLLPNVSLSWSGSTVSKDVAESSFGMQPQYSLDGGLAFQQLLFSSDANANLSAQKFLQTSREQNRATLELDIILQAAEAYLNVLRTKTLEQVQQDNLNLTVTSLRMAEQRERIGAAGPGERLRIQSELARRRADRIGAFAQRSVAETALNQILNRPLDEPFMTPEANMEGRSLLEGSLSTTYLMELSQFSHLNAFLVNVALSGAPEIRSLDAAIDAQERLLVASRQTFYLPTVGLQGNVSTNVLREGAGSTLPAGGFPTTESPDFPWSAGLTINLPLYRGNSRIARRNKTVAILTQLQLQRELIAQRIEQNLRAQLQFAQTSLAVVRESETAAQTAQQSLELITEAYEQGLVSVVDLLEAQTSALVSERGVTNAIFDYLINLKRVERAVGQFEVFSTPEQQVNFIQQMEDYLQSSEDAP